MFVRVQYIDELLCIMKQDDKYCFTLLAISPDALLKLLEFDIPSLRDNSKRFSTAYF
jgi:hypothetical protein